MRFCRIPAFMGNLHGLIVAIGACRDGCGDAFAPCFETLDHLRAEIFDSGLRCGWRGIAGCGGRAAKCVGRRSRYLRPSPSAMDRIEDVVGAESRGH